MNTRIKTEYDNWIISLTTRWCYNYGCYSKLMEYLHSIIFYATIQLDENRISDGKELRIKFTESTNYTYADAHLYLMDYPVTVLEVITALAMRCEDEIMRDTVLGDRTYEWFFEMLISAHLDVCDDDNFEEPYVDEVVTRILQRTYSSNGDGGLFTVNDPTKDLRKVEIWYQLMMHLNEVIFQ